MKKPAGFSLIEILIAVLILALGLLGLGVVFPVVIREQRIAQDRIGGATATNNIRAFLQAGQGLRSGADPFFYEPGGLNASSGQFQSVKVVADYGGWNYFAEPWKYHTWISQWREAMLTNPNAPMPAGPDFEFSPDGDWETDFDWTGMDGVADEYRDTGNLIFPINPPANLTGEQARRAMPLSVTNLAAVYRDFPGYDPSATAPTYEVRFGEASLPLADRLNPVGAPDAATPFQVWDIAVRRFTPEVSLRGKFAGVGSLTLETASERLTPEVTKLQVAVFVRRVDAGIRPPNNRTLRESFLNENLSGNDRRLPLGEDTNPNPDLSQPNGNGTDGRNGVRYSLARTVDAEFNLGGAANANNATRRDTIEVPASETAINWALIRQNGQKVVDNMGNIYTVVGSKVEGGVRTIKVDPPVPAGVVSSDQANNSAANANYTVNTIRELVFTPQVPVSVFVMEVIP